MGSNMKVLYIYHEYYERRGRYKKEIKKFVKFVDTFVIKGKKKSNQVGLKDIKKASPQLIWLLSPFYISENVISVEALEYIKAKQIPIAVYSTLATGIPYTEMMDTWNEIDFLFLQHKGHADYLKRKGLKSFYIPLGFYPDQYFLTQSKKKFDISFMGSPQTCVERAEDDKRARYIKALIPLGIKVYGGRFNKKGIEASMFTTHDEQRKVYAKSKVNLELPFINSKLPLYESTYHIKNRFFEIPATGHFLLTAKWEDSLEILDDSMVGYYEDNIDSLKETASKYIKDDFLRNKMAKKAYKIVMNNHTYEHRFKQMFGILKGEGVL